ncbi:hypothetical protein BDQ17DRAFT_1413518 [Cyathus striatus]|nr:hypothetical protein BDQ17DRAFT_1415928 [Cyathus striatus]KAF8992056.1 hypothetical protein BDQ17DRAFT_1413518 [Cyathus striatus]
MNHRMTLTWTMLCGPLGCSSSSDPCILASNGLYPLLACWYKPTRDNPNLWLRNTHRQFMLPSSFNGVRIRSIPNFIPSRVTYVET